MRSSRLRPCTSAELLAYQFMTPRSKNRYAKVIPEGAEQSSFLDERDELSDVEKSSKKSKTTIRTKDEEKEQFLEGLLENSRTYDPATSSEDDQDQVEITGTAQLSPPSPTAEGDIEMADNPYLSGVHSSEGTEPSSLPTTQRPEQLPVPATAEQLPADKRSKDWYEPQLEQTWKRTKTTGKGAEILEKIAHLTIETEDQRIQRVGFLQVRLGTPKQKLKTAKVQRKKDGDKNLRFSECSLEVQAGFRKSRQAEWQKW